MLKRVSMAGLLLAAGVAMSSIEPAVDVNNTTRFPSVQQ